MDAKRIAIVGLGLIGGSLGLALKQATGIDLEMVGFARRPEVATEAVKRKAVDRTEPQLVQAVSGADIVMIATPLMAMKDIFREIGGHLSPGSTVTDAGSTKAQVMKWAQEFLPPGINFIGGHPMTGKETSGLGGAEADLLRDCVYCLIPAQNATEEASKVMEALVESVGARPLFIDAQRHDDLVAGVSHLPILISSALVSALAESPLWPQMSGLAATGYRDMTRLASGSPEVNRGIFLTNQQAIIDWLDRYIEELSRYRRLVAGSDPGLEESLRDVGGIRQGWLQKEGHRFKG